MGTDKLTAPFNYKKDVYSNTSTVRTIPHVKASLVKVSPEEIKSKRVSAYRYLLP